MRLGSGTKKGRQKNTWLAMTFLRNVVKRDGRFQYEIAEEAEIVEGRFSHILIGRCLPTPIEKRGIATALNTPEEVLFPPLTAKKWLVNSAVIPAGRYGTYTYDPATVKELQHFLETGNVESRIGYEQTIALIKMWTGVTLPPSNRGVSNFAPGDTVMVVRYRYRIDPTKKGEPLSDKIEDWEIGILQYHRAVPLHEEVS